MSNPGRPLVSIITPSFNQAAFLPETLASVAAQTYPRIEHVVMDGGSTDGSVEIIQAWAATHPIIWRSQRDGGQADAIRLGAEVSGGEIITWLNSDDIYLDNGVIADVVAAFEAGARVVTGMGWYLDGSGGRERRIPVSARQVSHEVLRYVDWVLQPATFIARDLFLDCAIDTSLHYAFDWDLFIRLSARTRFTVLDREIAGYRRHDAGKTESGAGRRQRELLEVVRRHNGRLSPAYLLLAPVVAAHLAAERLPSTGYRLATKALNTYAKATQKLTGGRGIQY